MSKTFVSKESILKSMTLTDSFSQGKAANSCDIEADGSIENTLRLYAKKRNLLLISGALLLIIPSVLMGLIGLLGGNTATAIYEYFSWFNVIYSAVIILFLYKKMENNIAVFLSLQNSSGISEQQQEQFKKNAQSDVSGGVDSETSEKVPAVSGGAQSVKEDAVVEVVEKETRLSSDVAQQVAEILESIVVEKELFRQHGVSLRNLAQAVGVSTHDLSEVLNTHMKTSFYHYINSHRVAYAKEYLIQSKRAVLDIATDSGFNSKTAFYNAFKKAYGLTPSQYRTRCAQGEHVSLLEEAS